MAASGTEFVLLRQLKSLYDSIKASIATKVTKPTAGDGTSGQMLVSNGDGSTSWVDQPGEGDIGTGDLANGSVTTEKIADDAVTAEKIADGVIPDVSGFVLKTTADATYQPKGEYLTEVPAEYMTESEVSAAYQPKGSYLTSVPSASDTDFKSYIGF